MMLERSRVTVVADIFFSKRHTSAEEEIVHCRCSRAFVQDRELYRSDNRLLSFGPLGTAVQDTDDEDEEEEDEEEEEEKEVLDEEAQLMASLGLPLSFVSSSEQKGVGRRSNRKSATYWAEPAEEEDDQKDLQPDNKIDVEVCDPLEEGTGGIQDAGWETYWAQQGEALLWSSWLEKYPGTVTAPWDDPDAKAAWDKHAAGTYYSYWEQYSYWAAQGWTTDQSTCNGSTGGEAAAAGVMDRGTETRQEEGMDGQTTAERQQKEEVDALHDDVEVLNELLGQKCTLEAGGSSVTDGLCVSGADVRELCGSDDPSDGGNDRKRPAASSQQNTAEHTDSQQAAGGLDRQYGSRNKMSNRDDEDDDDDKPPEGGHAKVKRSHELDVEESPNLTPEEAWSKLGLKRNPEPL
ncbi:trimethylguanosine synthase-like [Morone saxatilis]|uniref:trimethylguanosine synthase-like n=1 Tax=Morone saxatilis TaxID=34816 RepID=UPI0015E1F380|nr:trimethylguanosine synthase-like [Morone saxatilis]